MLNFEFHTPTKVIFGKDSENLVGQEIAKLGFKKVLVHFGGDYLIENGTLGRIHKSLENNNIEYVDFDGVVPNPRLSLVLEGVALAKKEDIDFILAIGGGSAIDSSKAIAYGLANDFPLVDLFLGRVTTDKIFPVGCISTIAATGSETSNSTVVTLENELGETLKRSYNHDCARPLFAIMNPELTFSVPKYHTASGGADIMFHTMERYFTSTTDVKLTDKMAEGLLKTVKEEVPKVVANPKDYEVRANLMWAGSLSHNGLLGTGRASDFPVHKIAQELSSNFDAIHGATLTAIWSSWCRYIYKDHINRFAQFAVNVFNVDMNFENPEETAALGIEEWDNWCRSIGMPVTISELGIDLKEADIEDMAKHAVATGNGTIGKFFHELNEEDVKNIYRLAK
ncbi:iron-containing alcohol dehydrogenase [Enterococcus casseliflavus]|uniref:iron-containing alcohol dehydrogenase n=1 Tax=Enterococcus casseliflavus TaxID=37734 RepID=UPI001AD69295|nr:iron-containing alcohol dehydrogenase [Enterococcus casseliflavus]MBO6359613.1 iron-containing alcohol dehydrogenase [Enterococcus casseliflavus]MBO6377755.1 iron-containing alcohol dehydrogenase [Enterococcus casseliflavus]